MAAPVFIESPRMPDCIAISMSGGPSWSTERVYVANGFIKRNQQWSGARRQYDFAYNNQTVEDFQEVHNFWMIIQGAAGFRMRDWTDYLCPRTQGVAEALDSPAVEFQLFKRYQSGSYFYDRLIEKLDGPPKVYVDGVLVVDYTVDVYTGIVTFDDPPDGEVTWSGMFDVPVTFTMDDFNGTVTGKTGDGEIIIQWPNINVMELKHEDSA